AGAAERDRTGEFDYALYGRLGQLGLTGILAPEEWGGSNAGELAHCLVIEELSRADASLGITYNVASTGAGLPRALTDEQKKAWADTLIYPVIRGEATHAGAITEPDAGSDTRGIKTTAVLEGDQWVINGSKIFITNAGLDNCAYVMVVCLTDRKSFGFSNIIVPTGTPGYTIMPKLRKMGIRSSDTREIHFDDCRVPAMNVVGPGGDGRHWIVNVAFAQGRLGVASCAIGMHQACYDEALKYAQHRVAFGKRIYSFQYIQGMIVDMYVDLEISRMLRDNGARLVDQGQAPLMEAAVVKYFACDAAIRASSNAVQVHGGLGYLDDCTVSRIYRDVRWVNIGDGTREIQKMILARALGHLSRVIQ
ncbi:MAG: acyl-CoA dehydrogenase, partial [Chloroflexi bacterium]|nr:acyl-CoA dehydrogenase [Chloroflexota bacterium]